MPSAALAATIARIVPTVRPPPARREESITGSISSEVAKNTASMVPAVMAPHCGTAPSRPPIAGPALAE